MLTDGDEKGSRATLEDATSALEDQEIALDAVAFQSTAALTTLNALAEAGNGSVYSSEDAAALTTEFENAAGRLSRQLLVTATIPDDAPTGTVEIQVAGDAEGQAVSATALGLLKAETATPTVDASPRGFSHR